MKKLTTLLCCLLFFAAFVTAKTVYIDYVGSTTLNNGKPTKDTTAYINLLEKLDWDVAITSGGKTRQLLTSRPDTISFSNAAAVHLTSSFTISPALLNQVFALHYDLEGSVSVTLNGRNLIATGVLSKTPGIKRHRLNQDDFSFFVFTDTLQQIDVSYISHPGMNFVKLSLSIDQYKRAQTKLQSKEKDENSDFILGFYYLACSIVFMIFFIFFKERTESLYFSLFCFCAALSFLWDNFHFDALDNFSTFLFVFSLEFLSIFFVKILKNREKSKIPLIIILIISAISFSPLVSYNYIAIFGEHIPLLQLIIIGFMATYASISSLYFLIQGIGQKRWEARVVVICSLLPLAIIIIISPIIISVIGGSDDFKSLWYFVANKVGMCIYPLSAAIILARRNGMNQKQLTNQVISIEKLSKENLEKEKEKQQLLETQNTELERKVKERTIEVERQKELIEIKNKAITDNINYAQRIQSAILPDIKLIYKALEQSFILFLPKDIVSGDFYAFAEKNNRVLIIAGDCTGHGVSGAFMSMIGSSLLNQIINEKNMTEPAQILNELNKAIIETFRQGGNESNDGMDVSICSFDLDRKELQYAGANRPLWLVSNGTLETIRPDKFPIGGLQMAKNRTFTNYTRVLEQNDTIYIFTDGYADQFGGERSKKMMTAKFKEMLVAIQGMNMRQQETHLRNHFEYWKGDNEQVDDVLVIGVRI